MDWKNWKYQNYLPLAAIALLYGCGAWFRPLLGQEEYVNTVFPGNGVAGLLMKTGADLGSARIFPLLATLLTGAVLWAFLQLRSRQTAAWTAGLYLTTAMVFAAGTSAWKVSFFALAWVLLCFGGAETWLQRERKKRICCGIAAAAGAAGCWLFLPVLLQSPDLRDGALLPYLLIGTMPGLLLLSPVSAGWTQMDWKSPLTRIALTGFAGGLLLAWLGPAGFFAAIPFGALLLVQGLEAYFEMDLECSRWNRVIRSWVLIAAGGALTILILQTGARFQWLPADCAPYGIRGRYTMVIFAAVIVCAWWQMSIKESRRTVKFYSFLTGIAFLLVAMPALLPREILLKAAPAEALKHYAGLQTDPKVEGSRQLLIDRDLIPAASCAGISLHYARTPEDVVDIRGFIAAKKRPVIIITRRRSPSEYPGPSRRTVLSDAGIHILEFD